MKTAITTITTVQVGIDMYRDIKSTKIFDDDATIGEIKDWIIESEQIKTQTKDQIGLSGVIISNVFD